MSFSCLLPRRATASNHARLWAWLPLLTPMQATRVNFLDQTRQTALVLSTRCLLTPTLQCIRADNRYAGCPCWKGTIKEAEVPGASLPELGMCGTDTTSESSMHIQGLSSSSLLLLSARLSILPRNYRHHLANCRTHIAMHCSHMQFAVLISRVTVPTCQVYNHRHGCQYD